MNFTPLARPGGRAPCRAATVSVPWLLLHRAMVLPATASPIPERSVARKATSPLPLMIGSANVAKTAPFVPGAENVARAMSVRDPAAVSWKIHGHSAS